MKPFVKKALMMCLYLVLVYVAVDLWFFAPELGEHFHCNQVIWECSAVFVVCAALIVGNYGFKINSIRSRNNSDDKATHAGN